MSSNVYEDDTIVANEIAGGRHRELIGGMWEEMGPHQLAFLKGQGLQPHHRLMDIGCGALRLGTLAVDYLERGDAALRRDGTPATALVTDFSLASQVIELQRTVLGQLLSDGVAVRLLDSEDKLPKEALRLSELYRRLNDAVWGELGRSGDIPSLRRELQRDHVNQIASLLLRPAVLSRADARSLVRAQAQTLLVRLNSAAKRPGLSAESQAHLQDSADTLLQALTAKLARAGA